MRKRDLINVTQRSLLLWVALSVTSACSTSSYQSFQTVGSPDLGKIYHEAALYEGPEKNPVIVIPGFLGSRLVDSKSGKLVWGSFEIKPITESGKRLLDLYDESGKQLIKLLDLGPINPAKPEEAHLLSLPMQEGRSLKELKDNIVPAGVLEKVQVNLIGLPLHLGAYSYILQSLQAGGYREERSLESAGITDNELPYNCFQFSYDWRRDLVENVKRLHAFIEQKRLYIQRQYEKKYGIKDYDVQFDIVAHSMAGLLSRYYLLYGDADLPEDGSLPKVTWKGSRYIDKLIVVGTPHSGMLDAFTELVHGIRFVPILSKFKYEPALLGTWPAYYELLPHANTRSLIDSKDPKGKELDIYDPELWIKMKWGLADPRQDTLLKALLPNINTAEERRRIAIDHLRKCLKRAKQVSQALSVKATPPSDISFHLFAGDPVPTKKMVAVNTKTGGIKVVEYGPGDGVVLRSSALFNLRTDNEWTPHLESPIAWSSVHFLFGAHMAITREPEFTDNVLYILLES